MQVNVIVKQEHIDAGQRHSCVACPVALATMEEMSPDSMVTVARDGIFINGKRAPLPHNVKSFIAAFDAGWGHLTKPFKFSVHLND